jgi:hypothetical protein
VDCQLNIQEQKWAGKHIQLHFSHDGCSVLQKLLKYSIVSYLSPPTILESHTCTKNNWLLLFCLTKIQKKLIRTSHELFSYFTEIVLSRWNTMDSPHSKWGLRDSTVYCVHSTLYCMAPIGEELLTVFAASFRLKPVTSIVGLLWLLIRDPLTEVFYH